MKPLLPCLLLASTLLAADPAPPRFFEKEKAFAPEQTTVVLLGTGMPVPNPRASGPATAVVLRDRVLLFDAGPGVVRQLAAAGLPINGVEAAFFTHLHSDHTLGYPDLIFTTWVMGRRTPFPVFGPEGLKAMTDHLLAAWAQDIDIRVNGLERGIAGGHAVDVREVEPGVVYERDGVRVTAFAVPHGSWKRAYGYRIDTPGRSVVISGDTAPSGELARVAAGCDVLVHEVYPSVRLQNENRPGGNFWVAYMKSFHTSDEELGALAAKIAPQKLILHHIVRMNGTDGELLAGVRRGGFAGPTVIGQDLERH